MSFENIIGYKNVRNRFGSFLSQLNDQEKFASRGIAVPNGFLITGIEGLGKEFMADTFYKETGREGFLFSGKRMISAWSYRIIQNEHWKRDWLMLLSTEVIFRQELTVR